MNALRIEGGIALVTGANRGLGRALTEALLSRGVKKIYAAARHVETLAALRDARLTPLALDVTDAEQVRMVRELAMPKASPREVAFAILDGLEAGQEDIFPDAFARDFAQQFGTSPKASERQVAAMVAAMAAGSAA